MLLNRSAAINENAKLEVYWDDNLAEYRYALFKDFIYPSISLGTEQVIESEEVASGDYEWASSIAKHYGILVPPTED